MFLESPRIQPFQFPQHIQMGDKTSVMCMMMRGEPPVSYEWYKNGKKIKPSSYVSVEIHEKLSTLVFDPVEESSIGNYTCRASSPHGTDNYSAYLTVRCECNIYLFFLQFLYRICTQFSN